MDGVKVKKKNCLRFFTTKIVPMNSPKLSDVVINSLDASMLLMYVNSDNTLSSFITAHFEWGKYVTGALSIIYFAFSKMRRLFTVKLSNGNVKTFDI
jgi:hypothetical protein